MEREEQHDSGEASTRVASEVLHVRGSSSKRHRTQSPGAPDDRSTAPLTVQDRAAPVRAASASERSSRVAGAAASCMATWRSSGRIGPWHMDMGQPCTRILRCAGARVTAAAEHEDFVVVKGLDKASPKLNLYCCSAKQVPVVRVELCRASGDRETFMVYELEDVIVSSVRNSGSVLTGEPVPVEEVSFAYGSIKWTYTEFDPVTGKAKGDVSGEWNCMQLKSG